MPPREFRHALDDILEAIDGITEATSGKTIKDYAAGRRSSACFASHAPRQSGSCSEGLARGPLID